MSRPGIVGFLLLLAVVGFVVFQSMNIDAHTCDVCMQFGGRAQCRTVSGATIDEARQGAITNACAFISGGVTESMACQRTEPSSQNCR